MPSIFSQKAKNKKQFVSNLVKKYHFSSHLPPRSPHFPNLFNSERGAFGCEARARSGITLSTMPSPAFAASTALSLRGARDPLAGARLPRLSRVAVARHRVAVRMLAAPADDEDDYWPGELVCADCGYVYNNAKKKRKFEDLPESWVCPQCNASKRRFARKVGDFVEKTSGTDNTPIYAFSIAGIAATLAFFFWASQNL